MNEQELIEQLRQGNESAFRWLVDQYRNRVYHTALNILQDTGEAEDAAQETFIKLFETIGRFRGEASLSTWIYRIAVSKALDKARRKKSRDNLRRQVLPGIPGPEPQIGDINFYHPGIAAENKEKAAILFNALATLSPKQQTAFTLVKVQGMSYQEAGEIMQEKIKALESLVMRAKINLQKKLEKYYRNKN